MSKVYINNEVKELERKIKAYAGRAQYNSQFWSDFKALMEKPDVLIKLKRLLSLIQSIFNSENLGLLDGEKFISNNQVVYVRDMLDGERLLYILDENDPGRQVTFLGIVLN